MLSASDHQQSAYFREGDRHFVIRKRYEKKEVMGYQAMTSLLMFCAAAVRKHCSRMFLIPSMRA